MDRGEAMIVAGVGFSSNCGPDELADLVRRAQTSADRLAAGLAAPAWKVETACLKDAALLLGLPILTVSRDQLAEAAGKIVTHSTVSQAAAGVGSAAESAALAAVGPGARLTLARIASAHATCALAEGDPS